MLLFALWTFLVLLALAVLGRLAYGVFRKGVALVAEMGEAAELLGRAVEQAERLGRSERDSEKESGPAVFADPHQLRRARGRRAKRGRRASTGRRVRPGT